MFNTDYFGAYLWKESEAGRDKIVTIDGITMEEVVSTDGKKSTRPVAHLKNGLKPLVLNRSNCKTMQKLTGSAIPQDWIGKTISLYVAQVKAFGEMVDGVRIRSEFPNVQKPAFDPSHKSWAAAIKSLSEGTTSIEAIKERFEVSAETEALLLKASEEPNNAP